MCADVAAKSIAYLGWVENASQALVARHGIPDQLHLLGEEERHHQDHEA